LYFTWLKRWDLNVVKNIDFFIANSLEVQKRIKQVYGRDSELLYPFIDVNFWQPTRAKQNYFLVAGRLQYAKGLETVIEVFNDLHLPLHVVGSGRFESNLRSIAKPNVHFLGRLSDEGLRDEYSGALGFIYPQFEDFGMMPLEAASCGTATIGLAKGGSLETIIPSETGELLTLVIKQTLTEAIQKWDVSKYKRETLQNHAAKFSKQIFQDGLLALMEKYGVSRNY
jgi:glycosyltransferase involved in cell wall biosynthesis